MPPITTDDPAADALVQAYSDAWDSIQIRMQRLIDDPLAETKRRRLREMRDEISRQMAALDDETDGYVSRAFPEQYASAMSAGYSEVAGNAADFLFTQADRQAATLFGKEILTDLAAARLQVEESTRSLIRKIGKDAALRAVLQGDTARQASREMRRLLRDEGIHAVTYANGARHGLKDYAEMVVRSQTAIAYNSAVLLGMEHGAEEAPVFVEVFDGPSCGWEYHESPRRAHGLIVPPWEALDHLISHPNCRRAFGYRPDIETGEQAAEASTSTTPGQTEAQIAQDEARGLPTRRELAQRRAEAAAGAVPDRARFNQIPGMTPVVQGRMQQALNRPQLVQQRAVAAETRTAKAQAKATPAPAPVRPETGFGPSPANAPMAKQTVQIEGQWYPRYIQAVKDARPDALKGRLGTAQLTGESTRDYKDRWAASGLTKDSNPYDILTWAQGQSARMGLGKNIQPTVAMLGPETEQRIVKYLVDGGKMPDPPDLVAGTRAADVAQVQVRWDADRFQQVEDLKAWDVELTELQGDLTPAQRKALLDYSHGGDGPLNKALRSGKKDSAKVTALRAAMRPTPRSITVERGADADAFGLKFLLDSTGQRLRGVEDDDQLIAQMGSLVGRMVEDPGFLSTSVKPGGAFSGDVRLVIDVPEGTRAGWLRPYSAHPGEEELLLDRGTRLEIYDIEYRPADQRRGLKAGRLATIRARVVAQDDALGLG